MEIQRSFFTIEETFELRLPRTAKILHVDTLANGAHAVWAEVDPTTDTADHLFRCFETGETLEPPGTYVGTVIAAGAITEHHIFYHGIIEPEDQ